MLSVFGVDCGTSVWRYSQQAEGSRSAKPEGEVSVEIQMESQQQMLVAVNTRLMPADPVPREMCRELW